MGSATITGRFEPEIARLLGDSGCLAGEIDVVAAGGTGNGMGCGAGANRPPERSWVLCSSACGLAMIRLDPTPGCSGSGDSATRPAGNDDMTKDDGRRSEPSAEPDSCDDCGLSIGDMVRIQREIGRLSGQIPGKGKPRSKALAS